MSKETKEIAVAVKQKKKDKKIEKAAVKKGLNPEMAWRQVNRCAKALSFFYHSAARMNYSEKQKKDAVSFGKAARNVLVRFDTMLTTKKISFTNGAELSADERSIFTEALAGLRLREKVFKRRQLYRGLHDCEYGDGDDVQDDFEKICSSILVVLNGGVAII